MRKICSSAKVSWRDAFSARAEARSVPNGFSMMIRARSTRPACPSTATTSRAAFGGTLR